MSNLKSIFAAISFGVLTSSCSFFVPKETVIYSDKSWSDTNREYLEDIYFQDYHGNYKDRFRFFRIKEGETIDIYVSETNMSRKKADSLVNEYFENGTIPKYY